VSVPKLDQSLWAVTGNVHKLAKEDQLDLKPAKLKSHLLCSQKHTDVFGQILDIHCSTLLLCVVELLFFNNNLKNLRSVSKRPYYRRCARGYRTSHILTLYLNHAIDLLTSLEPMYYKVPLPECL
jgi:hypothetical protein